MTRGKWHVTVQLIIPQRITHALTKPILIRVLNTLLTVRITTLMASKAPGVADPLVVGAVRADIVLIADALWARGVFDA